MNNLLSTFRGSALKVERTKQELRRLGDELNFDLVNGNVIDSYPVNLNQKLYEALGDLAPKLAASYKQVVTDLSHADRHSWAGTAHEIRELVSTSLRLLAPDEVVESQPGYKPGTKNGGPSQKQRVQYIMKNRAADSSVNDMVQDVEKFEEAIASLVRRFYSRASSAAHTHKDRVEVARLLHYFVAFSHDLFDL